jgi:hypothetical protein
MSDAMFTIAVRAVGSGGRTGAVDGPAAIAAAFTECAGSLPAPWIAALPREAQRLLFTGLRMAGLGTLAF